LALAELYLTQDDHDAALAQLDEAGKLLPTDARVQHTRGLALEAQGRREEAQAAFARAVQWDGSNELYRLSLDGPDDAVAVAVQASDGLEIRPTAAHVDTQSPAGALAAAVQALERNQPAAAVQILQTAQQRWPQDAAILRALGAALYRQGDFGAAQVALRQSLSLDAACPLAYFLLAAVLDKQGDAEAAREQRNRAAQLDPAYAPRG
jgi:Flp pilus assembly protein TadD